MESKSEKLNLAFSMVSTFRVGAKKH